jgi:hypothetical protein
MGLMLVGVAYISQSIVRRVTHTEQFGMGARAFPLLVCLIACTLASALNPYHFKLLAYPFSLSMMWSTRIITEWMSPEFRDPTTLVVVALVFAYLFAQLIRNHPLHAFDVLMPALAVVMALDSRRHLPIAAIVVGLFLARTLGFDGFGRANAMARGYLARTDRFPENRQVTIERRPRNLESILSWVLLASVAALTLYGSPSAERAIAEVGNRVMAWKAIDFVARADIRGRGFNELGFGGYHIYRLHPSHKVFVDLRADTYGDDFIREYVKMLNGEEGWEDAFARHSFDYVVVGRSAALRQLLLVRGDFREVYLDKYNSVLVRKERS